MELTLGKRIVANRRRIGLTQDQLAEKLGVTAQAVSKWENDQSCPDISMLPRLAEIFGITTDELLGREPSQKVHTGEIVEDDDPDVEEEDENNGIHLQNGNWEFRWDSGRWEALGFAVLVLAVGALFLISNLLKWDVGFWQIAWPTALIVFGLFGLYPKFSCFRLGCLLFGGYFLLNNLGILSLNLGGNVVFAIVLVLFGLSLLVDALKKPRKPSFKVIHNGKTGKSKSVHTFDINEDSFECNTSFCERTYDVVLPRLSRGEANISFGEMTLDLSGVEEVSDDCALEANSSFGEMTLLIPKRFQAHATTSTAFADVSVQGQPDTVTSGTIRINANASFGEIVIRYI